uniref:Uncharacterized protein n=1 Tax=Siphoviridae sp. ctxjx4 TaxID=2826522 RepID=A0A8S5M2P5_9CAUD|nr:MAG TPA: hypothetical protein [Siphoviridae sp. ctxjx4]
MSCCTKIGGYINLYLCILTNALFTFIILYSKK